jgi:hypothetical protein
MFETFKRRIAAIWAENRLAALKLKLVTDAPVLSGSTEHERLQSAGLLADRVVISPDESVPEGPIL